MHDRRALDEAYLAGDPLVSDAEYQAQVGDTDLMDDAAELPRDGRRPHVAPLLGLAKVPAAVEAVGAWIEARAEDTGVAAEALPLVCGPKLDGLAINCVYGLDGHLDRVLTRGDGKNGRDVTALAVAGRLVPRRIPDAEVTEVRGELVMSWEALDALNGERLGRGETPIMHPRGAAYSATRTGAPCEGLRFVAWGMGMGRGRFAHWEDMAGWLRAREFAVADMRAEPGRGGAQWVLERLAGLRGAEARRENPYPADGVVLALADLGHRGLLGHTGAHPRWAVAIK